MLALAIRSKLVLLLKKLNTKFEQACVRWKKDALSLVVDHSHV